MERLIAHPNHEVQVSIQVQDLPVRSFRASKHFILNNSSYMAKAEEAYYIVDKGVEPAFIDGTVQCWVDGVEKYSFVFRWNDLWSPRREKTIVCFGHRPQWTKKIPSQDLCEDDFDTRFYLTVEHNEQAERVVLSDFTFVTPNLDVISNPHV